MPDHATGVGREAAQGGTARSALEAWTLRYLHDGQCGCEQLDVCFVLANSTEFDLTLDAVASAPPDLLVALAVEAGALRKVEWRGGTGFVEYNQTRHGWTTNFVEGSVLYVATTTTEADR